MPSRRNRPPAPAYPVWLLTESGAPPAPPSPDAVTAAIDLARACWQMLPALERRIAAWADDREPGLETLRNRAIALRAAGRMQLELCGRLTRDLAGADIDYALLKGAASRLTAYADPTDRASCDIDIGVRAPDLRRALDIVLDHGFHPAQLDPEYKRFVIADPVWRALVEAGHYELGFLVRSQIVTGLDAATEAAIRADIPVQNNIWSWFIAPGDALACYVLVDLHHGLSLDIPLAPLLDTAVAAPLGDGTALVPRIDWLVFHLIFKLYWEGVHHYRQGLHQYVDLARLVPAMEDGECDALLATLAEFRLEAGAYYVLRRFESDLGLALPPALARFVEAARTAPTDVDPHAVNDLGDVWHKLWGRR